jgi:hypothetical protein
MRTGSRLLATASVSVLVIAGSVTAAAQSAQHHAKANPWHKISTGPIYSLVQPALLRVGKKLDVVWVQGSNSKYRVVSRLFTASTAKARGTTHAVIPTWEQLNYQVAIVPDGKQRMVFFSGIHSALDHPATQFDQSLVYDATSADGKNWSLHTGSASHSKLLGSTGLTAVARGVPYVAFDVNGIVRYHHGVSTAAPASTSDGAPATNTKCCAIHPGIGRDAKSGRVWEVWNDDSGVTGWDGIDAQPVAPGSKRVHAPSSSVKSGGTSNSVTADQGVQVAGRPKSAAGGLFTAYAVGWPEPTKIGVWRLGAKHLAFTIKSPHRIGDVGVAAGRGGRLWVYWVDRATQRIKVARTNPKATAIGRVHTLNNPHAAPGNAPECLIGNGTAGPLDLVAVNAGSPTAVYLTRVKA